MKITVQYDLRLYSRVCLEQAVDAYSDSIEDIAILRGIIFAVSFITRAEGEDALTHLTGEFSNYVLYLENHREYADGHS